MKKIFLEVENKNLDNIIEILNINDIFNIYYDQPFEVTTTEYGYGYVEDENSIFNLNIIIENDEDLDNTTKLLSEILPEYTLSIEDVDTSSFDNTFEPLDLNNGYIICSPDDDINDETLEKIYFIPQGAFGTGLHETTQDCLRYILKSDLKNKSVLDIGTGSGILSLAAAKKDASKIVALDIRDVSAEIEYNASLNSIDNIEVAVGNALDGEVSFEEKFDFVIINIGGEETLMFKDFIYNTLKDNGTLLISGLVTWSYEDVLKGLPDLNLTIIDKSISNEWVTVLCKRNQN
ncbi:50S ribosomal protein L11 methyltransferase [uncultured Clostridium sp.]|uniref:50S ribosomal protein L11 methyltransferase n=1 Tax=uncultured Clostridium sp. TaxID=59620 RepID=UPI0025D89F6D|nr:50S ribosomal protein L11 methyltransferase [uncultured Clostridium sp.]